MTLYTVHLPREAPSDQARLLRAELVKDGFHWWAFLLPVVWLLVNRIWWGLLAYVALTMGVALLGRAVHMPPEALAGFELLVGVFLGLTAGDLKGWQLGRRGYEAVDVVSGRGREDAERRFFDRAALRTGAVRPGPSSSLPLQGPRPAAGAGPVIGLFPEAGGLR